MFKTKLATNKYICFDVQMLLSQSKDDPVKWALAGNVAIDEKNMLEMP